MLGECEHAGSADIAGRRRERRGLTLKHHFGCMKVVVVGGGRGVT